MAPLHKLTFVEAKLFVREPMAVVFGILLPSTILLVLGFAFPGFLDAAPELGGLRPVDVYLPVALVFALVMLGVSALPNTLIAYRERGVLRRLRTTPIGPSRLLGAQLVVQLCSALLAGLLAVAAGVVAFGIAPPARPGAFLLAFLLAAASLFAIGLLIAAVAPTASAGQAIGAILWLPLMLFAGLWYPRDLMPDAMQAVGALSPAGAAVDALQDAWYGTAPVVSNLGVMAIFAVVAAVVAARLFRWG